MLICPDMECDHREDVEIVASPADAVIFSSSSAGWNWKIHEQWNRLTLSEILIRMNEIAELYRETGNPKLPSFYRFWRWEYRMTYWRIIHPLRKAVGKKDRMVLSGRNLNVQGRIKELLKHSVVVEQSNGAGTKMVSLGDLRNVAHAWEGPKRPLRFDFATGSEWSGDFHVIQPSTRFVIVTGQRLILNDVTMHGLCRVQTDDEAVAGGLGMTRFPDSYKGEVPAALVERSFRAIRFGYVQGYRLLVRSVTTNPDIFVLATRNMEAARAFKMHRDEWIWCGEREQLRWWRYFHRDEIERMEEKQIPLALNELIRLAAKR